MSRYRELTAKIDGFFARVVARHGDDMRCGSGCSHCCHTRLSITAVEAQPIVDEILTWPPERKATLRANALASTDRCAALDANGLCLIYEVRPVVCRSHGAPIRLRLRGDSLPVVQACRENFTARGPAAADPDCILDQTTLSAMVLAVDRDAGGDGSRIDLDRVLLDSATDV
jgi:Fe-S-cluster containining protein